MTNSVRRLVDRDAGAYVALRREMLEDSPFSFVGAPGDDRGLDVAFVREQIASGTAAYFGADDPADPSRLIAVALIVREPRAKMRHRATIISVYVTPRARGRGLGRAVVSACIEEARRWPGVEIVALGVWSRAPTARRLYESLGFTAWGVQPDSVRINGVSDDEVYMQRRV
ncbi:MAG: N-acetyltransferase [Phycisphaerae bacterium]|nr:N-acetyltransferase [Phycisphaerae bacterium]